MIFLTKLTTARDWLVFNARDIDLLVSRPAPHHDACIVIWHVRNKAELFQTLAGCGQYLLDCGIQHIIFRSSIEPVIRSVERFGARRFVCAGHRDRFMLDKTHSPEFFRLCAKLEERLMTRLLRLHLSSADRDGMATQQTR
jgi:hypothetical protein